MERSKPAPTPRTGTQPNRIATPAAVSNSEANPNPHLVQARNREHYRACFQNEMTLIGAELHRLRTSQRHSLESVAKATHIPKHRLARIEHGTYVHFGLPDLYSLAAHYGVSALEIVSIIPGTRFDSLEAAAALPGP